MNEQNNNSQIPQPNTPNQGTIQNQTVQDPNNAISSNLNYTQTEILNYNQNNQINQVAPPTIPPNVNTIIQPQQQNQPNSEPPQTNQDNKKGGWFRQVILFAFLIGLVLFVFFLPEISNFMKSRKTTTKKEEVHSGTLSCIMENESDTSDLTYQAKFNYIDNKLKTSTFTLTIQDENETNINQRYISCQNMSNISKTITGIDTECRLSENMLIIIENYEHEIINKNNLTKFTESGGTYPEFNYQEDVNKVKTKMKKNGYDCKDE